METSGERQKGGTGDPQPVVLAGADVLSAGKALQSPLLSLWQHQGMNSLEEKLIHS